jgi:hypothetical protein
MSRRTRCIAPAKAMRSRIARLALCVSFFHLFAASQAPAPAHAHQNQNSTAASATSGAEPRLIEIIADHDSRFVVVGQPKPAITVTAGEALHLRITAIKAKNKNRDGAVHGFTLLHAKDHQPVPGWDLELQPGTRDYDLAAPAEPGDYEVVCTVICSANHEQMTMKVTVLPGRE